MMSWHYNDESADPLHFQDASFATGQDCLEKVMLIQ